MENMQKIIGEDSLLAGWYLPHYSSTHFPINFPALHMYKTTLDMIKRNFETSTRYNLPFYMYGRVRLVAEHKAVISALFLQ